MKIFGQTIAAGGDPELFDYGINSDGWISELYNQVKGDAGLIDTVNTTAGYNATEDSYGEGVVQTNQLYNSATPITSLLINEISDDAITTRGTVAISFDNGSSWSTATNNIGGTVTSFTGTSDDAGTYKLKLKFTLGAGYNVDGTHVWVTTGSLNVAKNGAAGCGTTSDALCIGGQTTGGKTNATEIWSGSSWATTTVLTQVKEYLAGCGTTSAALAFGGDSGAKLDVTEIWLGSSWVTTTALTQVKYLHAGCGTTSAALCFGGSTGANINTTEIWAGSSWVTTTVLTEAKSSVAGCGTTSAALCIGGHTGAVVNTTEIWSGIAWATTTSLTETKSGMAGCGTTSDALAFGGISDAYITTTEIWNGSIWSTTTNLTQGKYFVTGCGTTTTALCIGGYSQSANVATTEKWLGTAQKGFSVKIN